MLRTFEVFLLALVVGFALFIRLPHLGTPVLDEPSWRQADTAYMARRMMSENPPDLLQPKAPYRGEKDIKAAEFPVYPLSVALLYKLAGREELSLARGWTLVLFTVSAWYLFRIAQLLFNRRIALFAACLYAILPVGVFYSRAIHPDVSILLCSHAFLFHGLEFYRSGRWRHYAASIVWATLAFLMKAPYCFYLGVPLGIWAIFRPAGLNVRNLMTLAFVFVIPLAAALWFNEHRIALESGETESLIYPMKWTSESSNDRFFGSLTQRLDFTLWKLEASRLVFLVASPVGILLALAGLAAFRGKTLRLGRWCLVGWMAGCALYLLLVFPMVTGPHTYYNLPFMAPFAVLMAGGLCLLMDRVSAKPGVPVAVLCVLAMFGGTVLGIQRGPTLQGPPYFNMDWQRRLCGDIIRNQTDPDDLVLSVTLGRSTGWSDPRILYAADRKGWAIDFEKLTPENLEQFMAAGADKVALLVAPGREASDGPLASFDENVFPMVRPDGENVGSVHLFDLHARGVSP